jgi:hypothetical protein
MGHFNAAASVGKVLEKWRHLITIESSGEGGAIADICDYFIFSILLGMCSKDCRYTS